MGSKCLPPRRPCALLQTARWRWSSGRMFPPRMAMVGINAGSATEDDLTRVVMIQKDK